MNILNKKSIQNDQSGFSIVEILIVLVVLGAVVFVGFSVANRQEEASPDTNTSTPVTVQEEINDEQDLEQVEDSLDDIDLEELDTTELDAAEADLL
jgi:prepilin-type N-terminal cleavage/methylation domain-containing protein